MWILGVGTGFSHDASATLLRDGELVLAVEEERLDRVKFGKGFPTQAIRQCLRTAGIDWTDLDAVGFNFNPWAMWRFDLALNTRSLLQPSAFRPAAFSLGWAFHPLLSTLREADRIRRATAGRLRPQFLDHHLCHAASAFYVSPFDEAAILTFDNRGEAASATFSIGQGTSIRRLDQIRYPDSLGMLYLTITMHLGFHFGDEYKVMGLAAYGRPSYADVFNELVRLEPNGRFSLDRRYFTYLGAEGFVSSRLIQALGPRRRADEPLDQRHRDIACSLQRRLEEVALHMAEHLHRQTGVKHLCLAGGVAFNSVMNGVLATRSPFERVFVQPAAGDAGTSLGAALAIAHLRHGLPRRWRMDHAFLGPRFSDEQIEAALQSCKLSYEREPDIAKRVAELLAQGAIVGWFQGAMEWGPRALGARSILADPRPARMRDIVNRCIKQREGFRPFAPAVLAERAGEYFACGQPSPFMLFVHPVLPHRREAIAAVTHVDGSARVQTVDREHSPLFWSLIRHFEQLTGVPIVLNTSFNVNTEPIVCTPVDAIRCFFGSGLDALAIGPFLLSKSALEKTRSTREPVSRQVSSVACALE